MPKENTSSQAASVSSATQPFRFTRENGLLKPTVTAQLSFFKKAAGKLPYCLVNDFIFHYVFQTNPKALLGLTCSILHLKPEQTILR